MREIARLVGRGFLNTKPRNGIRKKVESGNVKHYAYLELLTLMFPNDFSQRLRKLDNVRKNDLSLKLRVPNTARKDKSHQTDTGFHARQAFIFLQARGRECRNENQQHPKTHKKHWQRDGNPAVCTFVHNIPRKYRRPQRNRQASPSSSRIFRMYQRVNPDSPFLHVSLREKVLFSKTI